MPEREFVVAETFLNAIDAEMAQSALEAAGIPSTVHSDDAGGVQVSLWMSGIELLVPKEDLARAREVLAQTAEPAGPDDISS